jgi:hypothetical protein
MPKSPRLIRRVAEKPGALAAVRIHAEPVHRDREWYRPAHTAQRQFTSTTQPPSAWRTPVEQ